MIAGVAFTLIPVSVNAARITGGGLQCTEQVCIYNHTIDIEKGDTLESVARALSNYTHRPVTTDSVYAQNRETIDWLKVVKPGQILHYEYATQPPAKSYSLESLL